MIMDTNTLYYLFSTIAQVLAATSALLAVFSHFKITELNDYLIGLGKSTQDRMGANEDGYKLNEQKKYFDRLRDSIYRRNIEDIQEVVDVLADNEIKMGRTLETNPRGLQYLKSIFTARKHRLLKLKRLTWRSVVFAFLSILLSLICLTFVEYIINVNKMIWISITLIFVVTSISLINTLFGIREGLKTERST